MLTAARVGSGSTRVAGTLNSNPNTTFQLDFYSNLSCDASGNGEGRTYIGTETHVTTNGSGDASFNATDLTEVPVGHAITGTANNPVNTSEFSACQTTVAIGVTVTPLAVAVTEGGASTTFTVALNTAPSSAVTIAPSFDAAQLDVSPTLLTFLPDNSALTPQTVTVSAVNNSTTDGTRTSPITFTVSSSDGQYDGFTVSTVTATITDNESAASLSVADGSVAEPASPTGTSAANLTATLSPANTQTVTVQYATANGTATGGAVCTSGVDYQTKSEALTFTPGQTSQPITVTICGDTVPEPNQAFTVALSSPTGGAVLGGHPTATVTITNTGGALAAPTADSYSVVAGTTLTVPAPGVRANDSTVGFAGSLTAQVVTQPGQGTLNLNGNGGFTYTPNTGFAGTDTFTYRLSDGTYQSPPATVTVTVTPTACVPRPRIQTIPVAGGGQLQVRIEATPLNSQANNPLQQIRFGKFLNATVTLNGQPIVSGQTYVVPANTIAVEFTVARAVAGLPTTVELTVVDGCGEWNTLVGGGTRAGF